MRRGALLVPLLAAVGSVTSPAQQHTAPPCPPTPAGYEAGLWQRAWTLHHDAILHGDDDAAEAQSIQGMTDMFEGQLLPVVVHRGCW